MENQIVRAENEQKRVFIWSFYRCRSNAFHRAVMNVPNTKAIFEPYFNVAYFGEDKHLERYEDLRVLPGPTFDGVQKMCEKKYESYENVIAKDHAFHMRGKLENTDHIPKNFVHTFLIRNPGQTAVSIYEMVTGKGSFVAAPLHYPDGTDEQIMYTGWFDDEWGFAEIYRIFELVTKEWGQKAIIVDADELLEKPEETLKLYCEATGLDYNENMMNWQPFTPEQQKDCHGVFGNWKNHVIGSTCFKPGLSRVRDIKVLPEKIQDMVADAMPIYEKMYNMRLGATPVSNGVH